MWLKSGSYSKLFNKTIQKISAKLSKKGPTASLRNKGPEANALFPFLILLRSEIPSGICAKLCTVAASNNRVHMPRSLYFCLFASHICMVLFFTHIPFRVNHTINATPPERLQQHPLLFTTNRTDRTFFVWRLNSARPSHPGHSTILLRSEIPSGICAKLRTVAASNNRVHMSWSLYYCLFAPHICMVLFFTHIPFVVNHTINETPPERMQQYLPLCTGYHHCKVTKAEDIRRISRKFTTNLELLIILFIDLCSLSTGKKSIGTCSSEWPLALRLMSSIFQVKLNIWRRFCASEGLMMQNLELYKQKIFTKSWNSVLFV